MTGAGGPTGVGGAPPDPLRSTVARSPSTSFETRSRRASACVTARLGERVEGRFELLDPRRGLHRADPAQLRLERLVLLQLGDHRRAHALEHRRV